MKLAQSTKNIWCEYSDIAEDECTSCIHFNNKKGGGRPKKTSGLNESIHSVTANQSVWCFVVFSVSNIKGKIIRNRTKWRSPTPPFQEKTPLLSNKKTNRIIIGIPIIIRSLERLGVDCVPRASHGRCTSLYYTLLWPTPPASTGRLITAHQVSEWMKQGRFELLWLAYIPTMWHEGYTRCTKWIATSINS